MGRMIIGVDPHKASVTIEVVDQHGTLAATGRFPTARGGYQALIRFVRQWPHRIWAVEGTGGAGRPLAQRLVRDGERVLDVPAKLAARVRVLDTGQGRKTDETDAHSIAAVAVHTRGLRELTADDADLEVMRLLVGRRDELAHLRVQIVNRLQRLLTELIPGGAGKKDLSAIQARRMLAGVRPRDVAGATRRRLAADLTTDLEAVDVKLKALKAELRIAVCRNGSTLMDLFGIGPAGAARLLVDVGTVTRFPTKNHFASWNSRRTPGRLLRPADPPPPLPRRGPADQPRSACDGDRPTTSRHPRAGLLPAQARRRQDPDGSPAGPETTSVRRGLPATRRRRPQPTAGSGARAGPARRHGAGWASGPGRTPGGDY